VEEGLRGGYRMIYPLPETEENSVQAEKYKKMLETSKELYEYFNSGKK
jgi:hemoglobin-like flavoprotein